jgi:hypothetical protein
VAVPDPRVRRYVDRLDAARRTLACEVEDDVAPVRGLTMQERGAWVASVCRAAWAILRARPDAAKVVGWQDPPAPDLTERWRALMARQRAARPGTP